MKYNGTIVYKDQKNNGFFKTTARDKASLEKDLLDRLLWLNQLGASTNPKDQEFYTVLTQTQDAMFGRAPYHNNKKNTGIAALAGAVGKLRTGDLSEKQLKNIQPVLDAMHHHYSTQWSKIEFEEKDLEQELDALGEMMRRLGNG